MTSKELPAGVLAHVRKRIADHAVIAAGKLPSLEELISGAPFFGGRIDLDIQHWVDDVMSDAAIYLADEAERGIKPGTLAKAMKRLRTTCKAEAMRAVREAFFAIDDMNARRLDFYLACSQDEPARRRLIEALEDHVGSWGSREFRALFHAAVMLGLHDGARRDMPSYCSAGIAQLNHLAQHYAHYESAMDEIAAGDAARAERTPADEARDDAEWLDAVAEDRVEFFPQRKLKARAVGLVVVPELPKGGTAWKKEVLKSWDGIAGVRLPFVARGDVGAHRRSLVERWPHAAEIIDTILGDLAAQEPARFRPTLLVGSPGSGKSSLVRAILETVGVPCELQSFAGLHDGALMGTSAQWSSARESMPLQLIKRARVANPGMIWDEIEKASTDRRNGAPAEALLPMLEGDQAKRYRDLCLEVEVDLSAVSHFATANSIDGIPDPVRDRMRVLTMPDPGWQHLGTLTRQILDRLARERGIDPRWHESLAEDELDLVRAAWPGGSIRQLTTIVRAIADGRAAIMGRC